MGTLPKLYFMVGVARSGKSTICNEWLNFQAQIENGKAIPRSIGKLSFERPRIVVNADNIRLTLHGEVFDYKEEDRVEKFEENVIRLYLMSGYDVLVDETHTSARTILRMLRIRPDADFCMIDTPFEECIRRAIESKQPWLIERGVIERMYNNLNKWKHDPATYINQLRQQVYKEREQ